MLRRSKRPNLGLTPKHLVDYSCYNSDSCYKVSNLPVNYSEAMKSEDSQLWRKAMDSEMTSLKNNNTFTITNLPEGKKAIGSRCIQ